MPQLGETVAEGTVTKWYKKVGDAVKLTADYPKDYKLTSPLKAGEHKLTVEFTNDTYKEGEYDSNFYLHGVKLMKNMLAVAPWGVGMLSIRPGRAVQLLDQRGIYEAGRPPGTNADGDAVLRGGARHRVQQARKCATGDRSDLNAPGRS